MHLTSDQLDAWHRDGYLHVPAVLSEHEVSAVQSWADDVAGRKNGELGLLQHYEATAHGAQIARSERLIDQHDGFRALIDGDLLTGIGAELIGEPIVLYKEKINYKLPGGAGFAPHQDAPAYKFIDTHLTCMVAIDASDETNGCLYAVAGEHHRLLPEQDGVIDPTVVANMRWEPLPMAAGDLLWFHSRVPHRSGPNRSATTRRGLFCTYNAASEGDLRAQYYDDKLRYFAARGNDTARLSTIADFLGTAPTPEQLQAIGVEP